MKRVEFTISITVDIDENIDYNDVHTDLNMQLGQGTIALKVGDKPVFCHYVDHMTHGFSVVGIDDETKHS